MDGVALCARFSLATNRLAYCGPAGAEPHLFRAAVSGQGSPAARSALLQFEALAPYLEAIAHRHGLDPFDERVVEAYWLGNELLEPFSRSEFLPILEALRRRGLPRSMAEELASRLPPAPVPHHLFHVAYVGVGNVTGHVPTTLENMERCRVAERRVVSLEASELVLEGPRLVPDGSSATLGPPVTERVAYEPELLPGLAPGDYVAVHWRLAGLRLSEGQRRGLAQWTARSLEQARAAAR